MTGTEVLIIGSGIAGATAALELARKGVEVTLVTKAKDPKETNTNYAQGGIIYKSEDDYPELLASDIEKAGSYLSNPEAARILSIEGPKLVKRILIDRLKVPFDREEDEELSLAREGGHDRPRIIHWADATGRAIQTSLSEAVANEPKIKMLTSHTAVDLLTPQHNSTDKLSVYDPLSVVGAYVFNQQTGEVDKILAKKTILATGGLGQIYEYSTNPKGARGDGIAMASRVGARMANLEYIQFHPTAFYHPDAPRFLVTDAVRGDGGRLVNGNDEFFMDKYDPDRKELAPRDVVARAIYSEMQRLGETNMYLDLKNFIPKARILHHFPNIYEFCLQYKVDITKDLVPIVPAAHYSCGGVWVDQYGRTTVDNLYAIGEVSCTGLHGANRLASTSLLEGLVWGERSARDINKKLAKTSLYDSDKILDWQYSDETENPSANSYLEKVKQIMWNNVGLVRNTKGLEDAMRSLTEIQGEFTHLYQHTRLTDEVIGVRNMIQTALLVTAAASENRESLGCHFRDF